MLFRNGEERQDEFDGRPADSIALTLPRPKMYRIIQESGIRSGERMKRPDILILALGLSLFAQKMAQQRTGRHPKGSPGLREFPNVRPSLSIRRAISVLSGMIKRVRKLRNLFQKKRKRRSLLDRQPASDLDFCPIQKSGHRHRRLGQYPHCLAGKHHGEYGDLL